MIVDSESHYERVGLITASSWVGIAGNALLAAGKIVVGLVAGSLAVVGDGIDSFSDVVTFIVTLVTAREIAKPPNQAYPYGRQRAETIATKVLSFIIFFSGAQLALSSLRRFLSDDPHAVPSVLALAVTGVSILGKVGLSLYLFHRGKKSDSELLIAGAKNMRNDVAISLAVLIGVFFTIYKGLGIIDLLTAFAVGLWIMKAAFDLFMESNLELMDGTRDKSLYYRLFEAVESVDGAHNPHRARIRKLANTLIIDVDVEVPSTMTVAAAHDIAKQVEDRVRECMENVYDVMIHLEPMGNEEQDEAFGVSRDNIEHNNPA